MSSQVSWLLELEVKAGRQAEVESLIAEMIASARDESGTQVYEGSMSSDGQQCHFVERYADSAAALVHLGHFGDRFASRFLDVLKPTRFVVYGAPDESVKNALAAFSPVYMEPRGGFSR